jgi:predicted dehydrogenase
MKNNRRTFLKNSSLAMAGLGLSSTAATAATISQKKNVAPSDQLRVGVIGCNGMGFANVRQHLAVDGVSCIALCDVDEKVVETRAGQIAEMQGKKPKTYGDYRKMLENKDIDIIIVGTPDHWHCLHMVHALEAGKHVYVEKPIANTIEECNIMVKAAKRYGKMVQCGQWQRSGPHYEQAIDFVRSGELGNIRLVKVWAYQGWMKPVPVKADESAPAGVDYNMWLGPAPKRAFNPNRFHFNFRWFWDYAGGLMTDWGVHEIDIALYAMNAKAPISVMASGGKFAYPDDASETPDSLQTVFQYDGFNMLWEHATGIDNGNYGRTEGIAFIGNNGTLVVNRQGWELMPETAHKDGKRVYKTPAMPEFKKRGNDNYLLRHAKNFVSAIRNNDASSLNCGIETGSVAAINAQMGNIAYKLGRKVYWDAATGMFKNDQEANQLMKANYHNGWKLPRV